MTEPMKKGDVGREVDLAVTLDQEIKAKTGKFKQIKSGLIEFAKMFQTSKLEGTIGTASVSISVGRDYQTEKVWKYLREEKKLSEKEALKYFGIKATPFQKDFGERMADRLSTDGRVTEKVILKKY